MSDRWFERLTRRRLLASGGAVAAASLGGLTLATERSLAFPNTMQVDGPVELTLDWRETYNGRVRADTTESAVTRTPSGPAVSLGNVLPGDRGSLSVRLSVTGNGDSDDVPPVAPRLSLDLSDSAENGRGEPERTAGDETDDRGELAAFLDVGVWYDAGAFGVDSLGGWNGAHDIGESLIHPKAAGPLADVVTELPDTVALDPSGGADGDADCLGPDEAVTVTFGWTFDPDADGINTTQSDSVRFDLDFHAQSCGASDR